jgi:hypothetical protein
MALWITAPREGVLPATAASAPTRCHEGCSQPQPTATLIVLPAALISLRQRHEEDLEGAHRPVHLEASTLDRQKAGWLYGLLLQPVFGCFPSIVLWASAADSTLIPGPAACMTLRHRHRHRRRPPPL